VPEFENVSSLVQAKFKISFGITMSIYFDTTCYKTMRDDS